MCGTASPSSASSTVGPIFSTSLPPAVIGASLGALEVLEENPGLGRQLLAKADFFKKTLAAQNLNVESSSQIMPLVVGKSEVAVDMAAKLGEAGFFVTAVRPPTVPENTARLRFSVTLHQSEDDLRSLANQLATLQT